VPVDLSIGAPGITCTRQDVTAGGPYTRVDLKLILDVFKLLLRL
jgi:hypothetical protein